MLVKNLAKLNRSWRNAASASLIVIAALAMYNRIVVPHAAYLSAAQRYGYVMDNVVNRNKTIGNSVKTKNKELQELRQQSAQLLSTLFTPDKAREFFSDLQAISQQTGCIAHSVNLITSQQSLKGGQSKDTSGVVTKSAVLSVIGAYRNITKLIERLQARTEKVWIAIKVRTLDYSLDRPRCDITITICVTTDKEDTL